MSWPSSAGFLLPETGPSTNRPPFPVIACHFLYKTLNRCLSVSNHRFTIWKELKPRWSLTRSQHQQLTYRYSLSLHRFAPKRHLYRKQPYNTQKDCNFVRIKAHTNKERRRFEKIFTERAAEGSESIAIVYLHFLITSAGVSHTEAPCSTSSSHCSVNQINQYNPQKSLIRSEEKCFFFITLESVLFQTVSLKPCFSRFIDMAFPMIPKPRNPISIFFSLSPLCVWAMMMRMKNKMIEAGAICVWQLSVFIVFNLINILYENNCIFKYFLGKL